MREIETAVLSQKKVQTREIPSLEFRAALEPQSFNKSSRTVNVVFSTGSRVLRGGFFTEPFFEELSLEPGAVRLERLNNGAPVLNNHSNFRLDDVIGVVERASIDGERGFATLRFSSREDVSPIISDIEDGIIRNVSIGYRVFEFEQVGEEDEIPIMRAIDFEPFEISVVPIGADAGAQIRSEQQTKNKCNFKLRGRSMDESQNSEKQNEEKEEVKDQESESQTEQSDDKSEDKEVSPSEKSEESEGDKPSEESRSESVQLNRENKTMDKEVQKAVASERKRAADILTLCKRHGMTEEFSSDLISKEITIDQARGLILDKLASEDEKTSTRSVSVTPGSFDEKDNVIRGLQNHFLSRYDSKKYKPTEESANFRNMSLIECASEVLRHEGVKVRGMSKWEIAKRAMHSSSDFPEILANVANKTLRDAFAEAPQTFGFMTREVTAPDFKEISRTRLTDAMELEEVQGNGEFRDGTIGDSAEKYKLMTFGKVISLTRQALINDDLDSFTRVPALLARKARDKESDLVWAQITSNPTLSNGNALFSAANNNLLNPGAAPDVTQIGLARALMRNQTDVNGSLLNVPARWLVGPPALETDLEKLVSDIRPDSSGNVNPFAGRLQVVVEPRLEAASANDWYVMSTVSDIDMVELARLEGEGGPVIETRDGWRIDGVELKIRHDAAAKVIEHRGMVRNDGGS